MIRLCPPKGGRARAIIVTGMSFQPGDPVHVASFGKGVVREVRNGGRYVVDVKGRAMVVPGAQLTAVGEPGGRRSPFSGADEATPPALARPHAPASIDLHGRTVPEATAAVVQFIDDAILAGLAEVRVIHGRSGGRIRAAVQQQLRDLGIRTFRLDPSNPGVTIVRL